MDLATHLAEPSYSFGPFQLFAAERHLTEDGRSLRLGSRAFDILHLLVSRAGETIEKDELRTKVWAGLFVEEANIRVHIAALRKALGDGHGDRRFIINEPGRGYRFVARVDRGSTSSVASPAPTAALALAGLPIRRTGVIGRASLVSSLAQELLDRRQLTIVGAGGIGKTTVALSMADALATEFAGAIAFVDLALLAEPRLVANTVASVIGLPVRSDDESAQVVAALRDQRLLLILDNCEHVINAVAALAEIIQEAAPRVFILATSREPLVIAGERVHRLTPLESPPAAASDAANIATYPAVQLFAERAAAQTESFALTEANAPLVAEICRRLDGLPLAIELAAGRVDVFGVEGLAARLDDRFQLLTRGRRTALPRQRTLRMTLDWSYDLLPEPERVVLRRVGIFAGSFSLEAVESVARCSAITSADIVEAIANLVAKSMVVADFGNDTKEVRFRLLEMTRAYARERLAAAGEVANFSARYVSYFVEALETFLALHPTEPLTGFQPDLDNIRGALVWAFSPEGDLQAGIRLASAAAALFTDLSLLVECTSWTRRALDAMSDTDRGTKRDMELSATFAMSLLFTQGNFDSVREALDKASLLAGQLGDVAHQAQTLDGLYVFHMRAGNFREILRIAARAEELEKAMPPGQGSADWMAGLAHYFAGSHHEARPRLERTLATSQTRGDAVLVRNGVDHRVHAHNAYGRLLWMQGFADQAAAVAERNIAETELGGHPVSHTTALIWMMPIMLWRGEFDRAATLVDRLVDRAEREALTPFRLVGQGFQGLIASLRGDTTSGIALMQDAIEALRRVNSLLLDVILMSHLAECYALVGRTREALAVVEEALSAAVTRGETVKLPRILQLKGELILARSDSETRSKEVAAENQFKAALDAARRQGARAYELRSLTSLARLHAGSENEVEALEALRASYESFTEGYNTIDLRDARSVLRL